MKELIAFNLKNMFLIIFWLSNNNSKTLSYYY